MPVAVQTWCGDHEEAVYNFASSHDHRLGNILYIRLGADPY
jgi:hypothetical protein